MGLPLPDDAQVTLTVGQLRELIEGRDLETFDGIGTTDAADITGEHPRTLRRLWARWDRIQKDGRRPEVRVSRKGSSDRSDLLFDRADCYAYRRNHGGGPREDGAPDDPPPADPDDAEAIAEKLYNQR